MPRWSCTLALCLLASCAPAKPQPSLDSFTGTWWGSASFHGARIELGIHVAADSSALSATVTCPDMLLLEQPLEAVQVREGRLRFRTVDDRSLEFDCGLDGDTLRGSASVPAVPGVVATGGEEPMRIVLGRAAPRPPPPYESRDLAFAGREVRLAGTVHEPTATPGRRPGIVILQGSSARSRDDDRFIADWFAQRGFAVLTFDKRGRGGSSGDYGAATYDDLADDAAAAVQFLRRVPDVDSTRVGVWGLSQGALLAPLVAARVPALAFVVAVSAPGMSLGECAAYQDSMRLVAAGFGEGELESALALHRRLNNWLADGKHTSELSEMLAVAADRPWRRASSLPTRLPSGAALDGWYWRGRTFDPAPGWRAVRAPVLALYGDADDLVPARASARLVERALRQGGNRDVTVRVFPSANHVLRTLPLVAGGPWDWPRAAPGYLEQMERWVREHTSVSVR